MIIYIGSYLKQPKSTKNRVSAIKWFKTRKGKHLLPSIFLISTNFRDFLTRPMWKLATAVCLIRLYILDELYILDDKSNATEIDNFNRRNKDTCPLPNSCQTKSIIYQAIYCFITGQNQKCSVDSCETTSKDRFENHKKSFKHLKHKNNREASKEIWEIKKGNATPKTIWKTIRMPFFLWFNEKYEIAIL